MLFLASSIDNGGIEESGTYLASSPMVEKEVLTFSKE